jgi:hypothetical protein
MCEAHKFHICNAEDFFDFLSYRDRISHSTMSVKLGKGPLKMKLRNLTLIVSRGPWRFRSWLSGLDSLKVVSRCRRTLFRTNGDQQLLYRELRGCLLSVRRFRRRRRGLCPDFSAWFISDSCIATCTVGHWRWWSRWTRGGCVSHLNLSFACPSICDVYVSYVWTCISSLFVTIDDLGHPAHHSLRLWESLSGLRSTVAETPTT